MKRILDSLSFLGLAALLVMGTAGPAFSGDHKKIDVVDVVEHGPASPRVVGTSQLLRKYECIAFELETTDLRPGYPYTLWVFIDENPAELPAPPGLEAFEIRLNVDGRFADPYGEARFSGFFCPVDGLLPEADGKSVLATDDGFFDDPKKADILLLVRAHGEPIAGMEFEQTTYVNGGCPPNACITVQEAFHAGDHRRGHHRK